MRERTRLDRGVNGYRRIERDFEDTVALAELAEGEKDEAMLAEAEATLRRLRDEVKARELESLLSGEADANDAYLEVHAGSGGTEAQDWAEMLLRMYTRWADQHGYKVEWLEESPGEAAGIKSATVKIVGENAYGWLKTESGVHRLVRISPFDANARRHTSFASVWVYPVVDDKIEVEVAGEISARRHLSLVGRGRPARQQDRQRGALHLCAARRRADRRRLPERALAASEPRQGDGHAQGAAL